MVSGWQNYDDSVASLLMWAGVVILIILLIAALVPWKYIDGIGNFMVRLLSPVKKKDEPAPRVLNEEALSANPVTRGSQASRSDDTPVHPAAEQTHKGVEQLAGEVALQTNLPGEPRRQGEEELRQLKELVTAQQALPGELRRQGEDLADLRGLLIEQQRLVAEQQTLLNKQGEDLAELKRTADAETDARKERARRQESLIAWQEMMVTGQAAIQDRQDRLARDQQGILSMLEEQTGLQSETTLALQKLVTKFDEAVSLWKGWTEARQQDLRERDLAPRQAPAGYAPAPAPGQPPAPIQMVQDPAQGAKSDSDDGSEVSGRVLSPGDEQAVMDLWNARGLTRVDRIARIKSEYKVDAITYPNVSVVTIWYSVEAFERGGQISCLLLVELGANMSHLPAFFRSQTSQSAGKVARVEQPARARVYTEMLTDLRNQQGLLMEPLRLANLVDPKGIVQLVTK